MEDKTNFKKMLKSFDKLLAVFLHETEKIPSEISATELLVWLSMKVETVEK